MLLTVSLLKEETHFWKAQPVQKRLEYIALWTLHGWGFAAKTFHLFLIPYGSFKQALRASAKPNRELWPELDIPDEHMLSWCLTFLIHTVLLAAGQAQGQRSALIGNTLCLGPPWGGKGRHTPFFLTDSALIAPAEDGTVGTFSWIILVFFNLFAVQNGNKEKFILECLRSWKHHLCGDVCIVMRWWAPQRDCSWLSRVQLCYPGRTRRVASCIAGVSEGTAHSERAGATNRSPAE